MADTIVVTGLGAVSALGLTAEENWQAARDGAGGIEPRAFEPGPVANSRARSACTVASATRVWATVRPPR